MTRSVILFDLDGTLTDPAVGILASTKHALAALGSPCPPDEVLASFIGPPLRDMFSTLLGRPDAALVEKAVGLYRERYAATGIYETRLYDGVPAMLGRARTDATALFVVTSKPAVFANRVVRHLGIPDLFGGVYGSELDGRFDNKAELIAHVLTAERVRARDAVMVGDRAADVVAADANGVPAIGVLWGYGSERELREAGARVLCATPGELGECLAANCNRTASQGSRLERTGGTPSCPS